MWYLKYLKNLLCIRVGAELFVLRVLLETQVYGLIFLDIMILIAEQIRAKIVEGRVNKLMAHRCLVEQPFVKNPEQTIEQLISGKFNIVKFDRFVLGEGLEKRNDNFADEVMSQLGK